MDAADGILGLYYILYIPGSPLTPLTQLGSLYSLSNFVCRYPYLWCINVEIILWCTLFHVSQNGSVIKITYGDIKKPIRNLNFRYNQVLGHLSIHPRDFVKMVNFPGLNAVPNASYSFQNVQRSRRGVIRCVFDGFKFLWPLALWLRRTIFRYVDLLYYTAIWTVFPLVFEVLHSTTDVSRYIHPQRLSASSLQCE